MKNPKFIRMETFNFSDEKIYIDYCNNLVIILKKIFKSDCKIDWNNDAQTNHNKIRGLSPYPGAWCTLFNRVKNSEIIFKIMESSKTTVKISDNRRKQLLPSENGILFPCSDNYICVSVLQMEGKRKMNYKEFIAGNSIEDLEINLQS